MRSSSQGDVCGALIGTYVATIMGLYEDKETEEIQLEQSVERIVWSCLSVSLTDFKDWYTPLYTLTVIEPVSRHPERMQSYADSLSVPRLL